VRNISIRLRIPFSVFFLASAGCGSDEGGSHPDATATADGGGADANIPVPLLRSGTVAIIEAAITNTEAESLGLAGAAVAVEFIDEATRAVAPLDLDNDGEPDSDEGGCRVTTYTVTDGATPEPTAVDEGAITFQGTGNGDVTCSFGTDPVDPPGPHRYTCRSTDANAGPAALPVNSTAVTQGDDTALVTIAGADFSAVHPIGQLLVISGLADANADGSWPVLASPLSDTLVIATGAITFDTSVVGSHGGYQLLVGEALLPGGFSTFLDDGGALGNDIVINGPTGKTGAVVQEFNTLPVCDATGCTYKANGGGFALNDASDLPHEFPKTTGGNGMSFSCNGTGGVCGHTTGGKLLNAIVISGYSTDAPLDGTSFYQMPDPVDHYAEFTCRFTGDISMITATLSGAAVDAILGTNPTRVRTEIAISAGVIAKNDDQKAATNIAVGHALAGFTDIVP